MTDAYVVEEAGRVAGWRVLRHLAQPLWTLARRWNGYNYTYHVGHLIVVRGWY